MHDGKAHEDMASGMHGTGRCSDGYFVGAAKNRAVSAPRVLAHTRREKSDVGQQTMEGVFTEVNGLVDGT